MNNYSVLGSKESLIGRSGRYGRVSMTRRLSRGSENDEANFFEEPVLQEVRESFLVDGLLSPP
jgi:hypothetical protein